MADTKISALTADTTPTKDDLIVTVNDPGGTPANRKVTLADLTAAQHPTSAYASLSAATWSGRLQFPSDGVAIFRDTGSANSPWGPIFPLTEPPTSGWSWVNQGSATVTEAKGVIHLACAANSSTNSLKARVRTAPTAPYTITALYAGIFDMSDNSGGGIGECGVCFRQTGTSEVVTYGCLWLNNNTSKFGGTKWDSSTAVNSTYINTQYPGSTFAWFWVQIIDDNTNRVFKMSPDGQHWITIHSVTRTDHLTADQVGIYVNPYSCETAMSLISWKEA